MSHAAVTVAVTRLLVDHLRNFRRQFVSMGLIRRLRVRAPKLILGQDRRKLGSCGRRSRVEMRTSLTGFGFQPGRRHHTDPQKPPPPPENPRPPRTFPRSFSSPY